MWENSGLGQRAFAALLAHFPGAVVFQVMQNLRLSVFQTFAAAKDKDRNWLSQVPTIVKDFDPRAVAENHVAGRFWALEKRRARAQRLGGEISEISNQFHVGGHVGWFYNSQNRIYRIPCKSCLRKCALSRRCNAKRSPVLARWPGHLPAGRVEGRPWTLMDLTASFLKLAGAAPPDGRPLDGHPVLWGVIEDRPTPPRDFFWRARRGERTWRSVRSGDWKLVSREDAGQRQEWL